MSSMRGAIKAYQSYQERLMLLIWPDISHDDRRTYICFALGYFFYVCCAWVGIVVKNGAFSGLSGLEMEPLAKVVTIAVLLPITTLYNYLVNYLQNQRKLAMIVLMSYIVTFAVVAMLVTIERFDPAVYTSAGGDNVRATLGIALFVSVDSLMSVVGSMFWTILSSLVRFNHANSVYPVQVICGQLGALSGSFLYAQLGFSLGFPKLLLLMSGLLIATVLLVSVGFEMHDKANLALISYDTPADYLPLLHNSNNNNKTSSPVPELNEEEHEDDTDVMVVSMDDLGSNHTYPGDVVETALDEGIVGSPVPSPSPSNDTNNNTSFSHAHYNKHNNTKLLQRVNGASALASPSSSSVDIPTDLSVVIPPFPSKEPTSRGVVKKTRIAETPSPMGRVANSPLSPSSSSSSTTMNRSQYRRARLSSAGEGLTKEKTGLLEGLKLIVSRKYVLCLAVISMFPQILNSVASYSMKLQAREVYNSPQLFAAFMANYGIGVNAMALLMASVGARVITRVWSLEKSINILPTVGIVISGVLYFKPSLALSFFIVIFLKAAATSLNTSAREMLYLHCSSDIRVKSKSWIDMAGVRGAKSVSALFNICIVSYPSESYLLVPFVALYFYSWLRSCWYLTSVSQKYAKGEQTYEIQ